LCQGKNMQSYKSLIEHVKIIEFSGE